MWRFCSPASCRHQCRSIPLTRPLSTCPLCRYTWSGGYLTLDVDVTCLSSLGSLQKHSSAHFGPAGRYRGSFGKPSQGWQPASSWRDCREGASLAAGSPAPGSSHQHIFGCSRQSCPGLELLHQTEPAVSWYWSQRQAWRWTRLNPARDSHVRQPPWSSRHLHWPQTLRCQMLPNLEEARFHSQCRCQWGISVCLARSSNRWWRRLHSLTWPALAISSKIHKMIWDLTTLSVSLYVPIAFPGS